MDEVLIRMTRQRATNLRIMWDRMKAKGPECRVWCEIAADIEAALMPRPAVPESKADSKEKAE